MSRLNTNLIIWLSALVIGVYIYAYYTFGYYNSKFGADLVALIGLSFMTAATTYPALRSFRNLGRTDTDKFIISYWSVWAIFLAHRLWVIYLGMLNTPETELEYIAARESIVSGLIAVFLGVSAGHGAIAPFSGTVELQKRDVIIFTAAGTFSGFIAGIAIMVFVISGWN